MLIDSAASPLMWGAFLALVFVMLALDLGVFHRKAHVVSFREATAWSIVWVGLALAFNGFIHYYMGVERATEFLTGYLVEKSLSLDNIFIIFVTFSFFAVPAAYQHRVLFWGILGALVMRGIFIMIGGALLAKFHWLMYVFGAILVFTAYRLYAERHTKLELGKSKILALINRVIPHTDHYDGSRFFTRQNGRWLATPLFTVLLIVEFTDLLFAVESIPAIFAITSDPFIVYTSNIFAILGMRSLYFMVAGFIDRFSYLKVGLAAVLGFIGIKLLINPWYKVPTILSLTIILTCIATSILYSLWVSRKVPVRQI